MLRYGNKLTLITPDGNCLRGAGPAGWKTGFTTICTG